MSPFAYKGSDLEAGLVRHLGKFPMELVRGFALVGEQCPIHIGNGAPSRPELTARSEVKRSRPG